MKEMAVRLQIVLVLIVAFAAIALAIATIMMTTPSMKSLHGARAANMLSPAQLPSPGLLYTRDNGNVLNVQSMLYDTLSNPDYTTSVSDSDMESVVGGNLLWNPPPNVLGNAWTSNNLGTIENPGKPNPIANTFAPCPAGHVVTGVRLYGRPGNTTASAVAALCEPVLALGSAAPVQSEVFDEDGTTALDLSGLTSRDFMAQGLYLTARNFLHGDGGGWYGNLLMDQSAMQDIGDASAPGWYLSGVQFQSLARRGSNTTPPWKPTTQNEGAGQNYQVNLQMTLLYYEMGDTSTTPREFTFNVWEYLYRFQQTNSDFNQWTYTSNSPLTTAFQYDASRTVVVDYGANGGVGNFKGVAVKPNSVIPVNGGVDNNLTQLVYHADRSAPDMNGFDYTCNFGHNRQSNNLPDNFVVGFNLNLNPQYPSTYLLTTSTLTATAFESKARMAQISILEPTCTGVLPAKDGSNPITENNVVSLSDATSQAQCANHANALCQVLGTGDNASPYCDCINSTTIKALDQIGINLPKHCLSNGPCMAAVPTSTWMDYQHVANCEKLSVDVCGAMYDMSAQTIALANDRFQCKNTDNRCTGCNAGIGTCKAIDAYNGVTPCRPKNPTTQQCGAGFVDCSSPSPPSPIPPPSTSPGLAGSEITGIATASIVVFIIVISMLVRHLKNKRSAL